MAELSLSGFELQKQSWWKPSPTFSAIVSWTWITFLAGSTQPWLKFATVNFWRAFQVLIGSALFYMGKLNKLATKFWRGEWLTADTNDQSKAQLWLSCHSYWIWKDQNMVLNLVQIVGSHSKQRQSLVPVANLFNHSSHDAHVKRYSRVSISDKMMRFPVSKPCSSGKQVFLSYGPLPNWRLLLFYGFALQDNPHDSLQVRILLDLPLLIKCLPVAIRLVVRFLKRPMSDNESFFLKYQFLQCLHTSLMIGKYANSTSFVFLFCGFCVSEEACTKKCFCPLRNGSADGSLVILLLSLDHSSVYFENHVKTSSSPRTNLVADLHACRTSREKLIAREYE